MYLQTSSLCNSFVVRIFFLFSRAVARSHCLIDLVINYGIRTQILRTNLSAVSCKRSSLKSLSDFSPSKESVSAENCYHYCTRKFPTHTLHSYRLNVASRGPIKAFTKRRATISGPFASWNDFFKPWLTSGTGAFYSSPILTLLTL